MICVKDAAMDVVHLSPEWQVLTGIAVSDAFGRGWLRAVHAEDRPLVGQILDRAARERAGYAMVYRLMRQTGTAAWVSDGATPSFAAEDHRFIGVSGSITEIPPSVDGASGDIDRSPESPPTPTREMFDLLFQHVAFARGLAARSGDSGLVEALDVAFYLARRRCDRAVH